MPDRQLIRPKLPGGFRDFPPDDFARRQWALERAVEVYHSFGFKPLDTSSVEHFETLAGGDETSKQIYRLFNQTPDYTGESLALRFDLTVSLARMLAANRRAFTFPFKRYQIGEVWRGERQQKGRFKQFLQMDADIVGTASPAADAEIILLVDRTMKALGVEKFSIKLNNRKVLNGFIRSLGIDAEEVDAFLRILDKLDKVGWKGVQDRLAAPKSTSEEMERGAEGMGMDKSAIDRVERFINLSAGNYEKVKVLRDTLKGWETAAEGLEEIETILKLIDAAGLSPGCTLSFEPSVARGLGYYTGPVYETFIDDLPDLGSVMSGGRYDNLVERFSSEAIAATGVSLGVDRLMVGLAELGQAKTADYVSEVLVVGMGSEFQADAFRIASTLREAGVRAEVFLGDSLKLKKQMSYADRTGVKFCAIIGSEEKSHGTAQLKNMSSGVQREIALDKISAAVKGD